MNPLLPGPVETKPTSAFSAATRRKPMTVYSEQEEEARRLRGSQNVVDRTKLAKQLPGATKPSLDVVASVSAFLNTTKVSVITSLIQAR